MNQKGSHNWKAHSSDNKRKRASERNKLIQLRWRAELKQANWQTNLCQTMCISERAVSNESKVCYGAPSRICSRLIATLTATQLSTWLLPSFLLLFLFRRNSTSIPSHFRSFARLSQKLNSLARAEAVLSEAIVFSVVSIRHAHHFSLQNKLAHQ